MSSSAALRTASDEAALEAEAARRFRKSWPSIVRIAIIEVVVLVALAGAFVAYLNWSSEESFAEFLAVSKMQVTPVSPPGVVKASWPCGRIA